MREYNYLKTQIISLVGLLFYCLLLSLLSTVFIPNFVRAQIACFTMTTHEVFGRQLLINSCRYGAQVFLR